MWMASGFSVESPSSTMEVRFALVSCNSCVFIYRYLKVWRHFLSHRDVMPLSPPGEITSWKTSGAPHWCRLQGLTSSRHVRLPPCLASFASFYNSLGLLSLWDLSTTNSGCLSCLLPFLSCDLDHDCLTVFWIQQTDLEWNSLNPLKESPLKLLGTFMLC